MHAFIHSFHFVSFHLNSLLHSLTRSLTHSLTHARTRARTHARTHSLTHSFIPSFIHSFIHPSIHPFIHSKFQFNSAHFNSIQFNSNQFISIFHLFSSIHSFQFMSFQLTNNSYKQTGSYSHVLILKLAPRRVLGTTWYIMQWFLHNIYIYMFFHYRIFNGGKFIDEMSVFSVVAVATSICAGGPRRDFAALVGCWGGKGSEQRWWWEAWMKQNQTRAVAGVLPET